MTQNCKVVIEFISYKEEFLATWNEDGIKEGEDIAEQVFFNPNPQIYNAFSNNEYPDMSVYLIDLPEVSSRVNFDEMAGLIYPSKNLTQAKNRSKKLK